MFASKLYMVLRCQFVLYIASTTATTSVLYMYIWRTLITTANSHLPHHRFSKMGMYSNSHMLSVGSRRPTLCPVFSSHQKHQLLNKFPAGTQVPHCCKLRIDLAGSKVVVVVRVPSATLSGTLLRTSRVNPPTSQ